MKQNAGQVHSCSIFEISRDGKKAFFLGTEISKITTPGNSSSFLQENRPVSDQARKRVSGSYNAEKEFKAVTESLCSAEAHLLRKLNSVPEDDLNQALKEISNILHIAGQVRSRITQTISDRQQEDIF